MPKLYLLLLFSAFIGACSRDPSSASPGTSPVPDTKGYIQYKMNGNLVTIKNTDTENADHILCTKQTQLNVYTPTMYLLSAVNDGSNSFDFAIVSDSLLVGNNNIVDADLKYNGQLSQFGDVSIDSLNVNITSYSKGLISGNFSGQLSLLPNPIPTGPIDWSSLPKTTITEGEFKNIKCIYH